MKNKLTVKKRFDLPKQVKKLENITIKVGFPSESPETQSTKDGVSAVFKATVNNFGLGNNPKRPFMNIAFAKNKREYRKIIIKSFKKIETLDVVKFSNKLGLKGQGDVQKEIVALRSPANSEVTVKAKGSSNPLIDSGHMVGSVTYQVIEKGK